MHTYEPYNDRTKDDSNVFWGWLCPFVSEPVAKQQMVSQSHSVKGFVTTQDIDGLCFEREDRGPAAN